MLAVSWNVMSLTADDRCNALRQTKRMGGVLFLIIHACQGGYPACLYHEHFNVHHITNMDAAALPYLGYC